MDGKKGNKEEPADGDEKVSYTGDDKNTNRNTGGTEEENGEEIKTPCGQDPMKQEIYEELVYTR